MRVDRSNCIKVAAAWQRVNSEGYKYAQMKKLASVRPGIILPPFPQPVTYTAPFDLPPIPAPQLFNGTGQEIAIKGWKGPRWNHNYGFTAENFARAVEPYIKNIDSIEINNIIPGMGIIQRTNLGTGGVERCLFIPERLLEMDPGLNGLSEDYPHFTMRSVSQPALLSSQRMTDLFGRLYSTKGAGLFTKEDMVEAVEMKYGIASPGVEYGLDKIASALRSTRQWICVLLMRGEQFLFNHAASRAMLEETRLTLSAVISWLLEYQAKLSTADLKQALLDLNLAEKQDADHIAPWLALVDKVLPEGLRYLGQKMPGSGLVYIKENQARPKHFDLATATIKVEPDKSKTKLSAAEDIVRLIGEQKRPLSFHEIARLRGNSPNTVQQIIDKSGIFCLVGNGVFAPLADFPELKKAPFLKVSRRKSSVSAAAYVILKASPEALSVDQIFARMEKRGFLWTKSALRKVLSENDKFSRHFVCEKGKYRLRLTSRQKPSQD